MYCYSDEGLSFFAVEEDYEPHDGEILFSDIATPDQLSAAFPSYNTAMAELRLDSEIRSKRNALLDDADTVYCNAEKWEAMTPEQKAAWRAYKQALRDLPATIDLDNPVWPTRPA